ncbi:hypothetical protein FGD71_012685 [Streptomyces sporangiiformans]|uniref:Uncharacterized protein n=1 Tax=Streptomyces sporangiiformans TaxID=2315329 RepID=A0A505DFW2_9ACTN|nr:hypothetical protein FGD71_012685 [Streptomyces sporangiiformans]
MAAIALCALIHGPSEEAEQQHRTPALTTASSPASVSASVSASAPASALVAVPGDAVPHGPHRHHGDEECALDEAVRTTVQAAHQPPAEAEATAFAGLSTALVRRSAANRRPYRLRSRRTGRTALVRTSRWRI